MKEEKKLPGFVFESSWEVCNKIGGIYTVLSTHAKSLGEHLKNQLVFIGPDFWQDKENPLFIEDKKLWTKWTKSAAKDGLCVRVGRWNIPGNPYVILVDFKPYFEKNHVIYGEMWNDFGVDSLHAYGDYDEASMFAYAAGLVVESYYHFFLEGRTDVIYQAHEWMTCMGALYIQKKLPQIATVFTTHATSIGRSIAGNGKPLYEYLPAYNGVQMSQELNIESKHSIERQTAHHVDCFTSVSDVTARECAELLDRACDEVLMNGFEPDFVPTGAKFTSKRKAARKRILEVASALTGNTYADDTLIVSTSGRYEYRNKGIDVFLESLYRCLYDERLGRKVLALIEVPGWIVGPRTDLQEKLKGTVNTTTALPDPFYTHWLHEPQHDEVCRFIQQHGMRNNEDDRVNVIFVPCYLDGQDGIFNLSYYDTLIGQDLAVYPSYYEPWGYTPLEAVAFHVPCITTSLSGFGAWVNLVQGKASMLEDGVEVVPRTDYNFNEVADAICAAIARFSRMEKKETDKIRKRAAQLAEKAEWKHFIKYYLQAYEKALVNAAARNAN